jgi:hypothetical protein
MKLDGSHEIHSASLVFFIDHWMDAIEKRCEEIKQDIKYHAYEKGSPEYCDMVGFMLGLKEAMAMFQLRLQGHLTLREINQFLKKR